MIGEASLLTQRHGKPGSSVQVAAPPRVEARARPMLYQLHLLRAIAVLLVVLDHTCLAIGEHMPVHPLLIQLAWLSGFLGVAIFFTISGYIMVETTRSQPSSGHVVVPFLLRRLMRIVPMYYLATGLYVVAQLAHVSGSSGALNPVTLFCSLLFIPIADAGGVVQPVLTQGWTLNNEMFFYLLFGVSLLLPGRVRAAALAALLVGLVASVPLFGQAGYDIGEAARFLAAPIVLNFASGLLLASYGRPTPGRGSAWRPILLILILLIGQFAAVTYAWATLPGHALVFGWWLHASVCSVATCCCWLCTRSNTPLPAGGAAGAMGRLGLLLGDASYVTYLFHLFVIAAVVRICMFAGIGPAGTGVCGVILAMAVSVLLHCQVERPVNAWMRRLHGRNRGVRVREIHHSA